MKLRGNESSQIVNGVAMIEAAGQTAPVGQTNLNRGGWLISVNVQFFAGPLDSDDIEKETIIKISGCEIKILENLPFFIRFVIFR